MGQLAKLVYRAPVKVQTRTVPAANPANVANPTPEEAKDSQDSQDSQGGGLENYTRLLAAAAAEDADTDLIHQLPAADVTACGGLPDNVLHTYVRALETQAIRMAGRVPTSETEPIICTGCGPVWVTPEVAAVLPVINGTPLALGCPWCHVRKTGKYVPRPRVQCVACTHYVPDDVNPAGGAGHCGLKPTHIHRMHYPKKRHRCADWRP